LAEHEQGILNFGILRVGPLGASKIEWTDSTFNGQLQDECAAQGLDLDEVLDQAEYEQEELARRKLIRHSVAATAKSSDAAISTGVEAPATPAPAATPRRRSDGA
jgi:hypothetical protein